MRPISTQSVYRIHLRFPGKFIDFGAVGLDDFPAQLDQALLETGFEKQDAIYRLGGVTVQIGGRNAVTTERTVWPIESHIAYIIKLSGLQVEALAA